MPPNGSVTVVYQVQVSDPIPGDASAVTNAAYEDGMQPDCVGSPLTCSSIPVSGGVVLTKDITDEDGLVPDVAEPGETLTYTITLTNTGAGGTSYDLADDLDQYVAYVGPTSGTAGAGEPTGTDPLVWSAIQVPASDSVTVVYEAQVANDIPQKATTIANIAYEDGTTPDCAATPAACVQRPFPER